MNADVTLQSILSPLPISQFFEEFWQHKCLIHRSKSSAWKQLITLAEIEFLISSLADPTWLSVITDGRASPSGPINSDHYVDLVAVREAYANGSTILLTKLHKRSLQIGTLCRNIEHELISAGIALSRRIGVNLYLTPPRARGFPAHYDDHDVLILQMEGSKHWKLYDSLERFPLTRQLSPVPPTDLPPLRHAKTIEPGDILYIPRGVYHEAATCDDYSLHLTIGLYPYTWLDLCHRLLECVERCREAIPPGVVNGLNPVLDATLRQICDSVLTGPDRLSVAKKMFHEFVDNLDPVPGNCLGQIHLRDEIRMGTKLLRQKAVLGRFESDESGKLRFVFSRAGIRGPREIEPAMTYILNHEEFSVGDLPGDLCEESQIDIARQLVEAGFLKLVNGQSGTAANRGEGNELTL
jgi:hypothetical protein